MSAYIVEYDQNKKTTKKKFSCKDNNPYLIIFATIKSRFPNCYIDIIANGAVVNFWNFNTIKHNNKFIIKSYPEYPIEDYYHYHFLDRTGGKVISKFIPKNSDLTNFIFAHTLKMEVYKILDLQPTEISIEELMEYQKEKKKNEALIISDFSNLIKITKKEDYCNTFFSIIPIFISFADKYQPNQDIVNEKMIRADLKPKLAQPSDDLNDKLILFFKEQLQEIKKTVQDQIKDQVEAMKINIMKEVPSNPTKFCDCNNELNEIKIFFSKISKVQENILENLNELGHKVNSIQNCAPKNLNEQNDIEIVKSSGDSCKVLSSDKKISFTNKKNEIELKKIHQNQLCASSPPQFNLEKSIDNRPDFQKDLSIAPSNSIKYFEENKFNELPNIFDMSPGHLQAKVNLNSTLNKEIFPTPREPPIETGEMKLSKKKSDYSICRPLQFERETKIKFNHDILQEALLLIFTDKVKILLIYNTNKDETLKIRLGKSMKDNCDKTQFTLSSNKYYLLDEMNLFPEFESSKFVMKFSINHKSFEHCFTAADSTINL